MIGVWLGTFVLSNLFDGRTNRKVKVLAPKLKKLPNVPKNLYPIKRTYGRKILTINKWKLLQQYTQTEILFGFCNPIVRCGYNGEMETSNRHVCYQES